MKPSTHHFVFLAIGIIILWTLWRFFRSYGSFGLAAEKTGQKLATDAGDVLSLAANPTQLFNVASRKIGEVVYAAAETIAPGQTKVKAGSDYKNGFSAPLNGISLGRREYTQADGSIGYAY